MRFAMLFLILAGCQSPAPAKSATSKEAEAIARNVFAQSIGSRVVKTSSANLSDCLLWSGSDRDSDETVASNPEYLRPTDLKGWVVVCEMDYNGDNKPDGGIAVVVDSNGNVRRSFNSNFVKFTGGQAARKAGRKTTSGTAQDAFPLQDALKAKN